MQSVRAQQGLQTDAIRGYLTACDKPFTPSKLFSTASSSHFRDAELRLSESRRIVDPCLFDLCSALVDQVSEQDVAYRYTLCRDDVTELRYKAGGFFQRHVDHCRGVSNLIEEFTLLINVNAPGTQCEGGETIVHVPMDASGGTSAVSFDATAVAGGALLFRKDVEHEGAKVLAGEKNIVALNLWGRRRKAGQVLVVTFAQETDAVTADFASAAAFTPAAALSPGEPSSRSISPCAGTSPVDVLRSALDGKYVLAAEDASASHVLKQVIEDACRCTAASKQVDAPSVLAYECPIGVTHASFDAVWRVCCRMHVTTELLQTHKPTLDFFFPGANFNFAHLLLETHPPGDAWRPGRTVTICGTGVDTLDGKTAVILGDVEREPVPASEPLPKRPKTAGTGGSSGEALEEDEGAHKQLAALKNDSLKKVRVRLVHQAEESGPAASGSGDDRLGAEYVLSKHKLIVSQANRLVDSIISLPSPAEEEAAEGVGGACSATGEDPDVLLFSSAERTKVAAQIARDLKLPFVEFCFVFVRGNLSDDGGERDIPLSTCWLSLGAYDNVFSFQQVVKRYCEHNSVGVSRSTLDEKLRGLDYFKKAHRMKDEAPPASFIEFDEVYSPLGTFGQPGKAFDLASELTDDTWGGWEAMQGEMCFGLKVAAPSASECCAELPAHDLDEEDAWEPPPTSGMLDLIFGSQSLGHNSTSIDLPVGLRYLPGRGHDKEGTGEAAAAAWQAAVAAVDTKRKIQATPMVAIAKKLKADELLAAYKNDQKDDFVFARKDPIVLAEYKRLTEAADAKERQKQAEAVRQKQAALASSSPSSLYSCAPSPTKPPAYSYPGYWRQTVLGKEAEGAWTEEMQQQAEADFEGEYIPPSPDDDAFAEFECEWRCENDRDEYGYGCASAETDQEKEIAAVMEAPLDVPAGEWLFHRDASGKTCFSEAEARAASELIAAMSLDERVVKAMKHVQFAFPQEQTRVSEHICNCTANGQFDLLHVTGLVRLESVGGERLKAMLDATRDAQAKREKAEQEKRMRWYEERERQWAQEESPVPPEL